MPEHLEPDLPFWPYSKLRLAALCGMVGPPLGLLFMAVAILTTPWFSFTDNALSDLGSWGEPGAVWFNVGVMLAGALSASFVYMGIRPLVRHLNDRSSELEGLNGKMVDRPMRIIVLLASGTGGLFLIGIFTVDDYLFHVIMALLFFLCTPIGIIELGHLLKTMDQIMLGNISIWMGGLGLLFALLVIGSEMVGENGIVIPELILVIILASWQCPIALRIWRFHPQGS